uniref:Myristylated membrane protein n=1 Tax=Rhinella marina erythrocytic-like virus TaxID=2859906 RepID=A0A8F6UAD0_9VIRU|nr:myristylated membrane protein [Rhinella marina erythrocytic-like virus]
MGGNFSKQVTALTEKAVMSVAMEYSQKNTNKINSTQNIEITEISGDVKIHEIILDQQAEIDIKQSIVVLADNEAKSKLSDKILQESKQMVSGISLAQANYSEANMHKNVKVLHNFSSSVAQHCSSSVNQSQAIKIRGVEGSLRLKTLLLQQITGIASHCVKSISSSNKSIIDLETDIQQKTDQLVKGINPLMLVGLLGLGLLGVPLITGGLVMKFLGPLLIVTGIGITGYAITIKETNVELKLFSGLYNKNTYGVIDMTHMFYTSNSAATLDYVVEVFKKHQAYAFDFDRCNKKVYFYTDPAITKISLSTQPLNPNPKLYTQNSNLKIGDVYYNQSTGELSQKCTADNKFIQLGILEKNKKYNLDVYVLTKEDTREEISIQWPNITNVSGWKTGNINKPILISGIMCIIIGFILLIIQNFNKKTNEKPNNKPL